MTHDPAAALSLTERCADLEVWLRLRDEREDLPSDASQWDDWGMPYAEDLPQPTRVVVMVTHPDGSAEPVGTMSWIPVYYGPTVGCRAWSIGIGLVESWRSRGIGTVAQRLLCDHLFASTDVERIEASTDVENHAEQRALEKAGFTREGVTRAAQWRADGRHHDLVVYSRIRNDLGEQAAHP